MDPWRGFGQVEQLVVELALADGGGADDESAVGDGLGDRGKGARGGHHLGGVDGGLRSLKRWEEFIDHAEGAEAEVVHGAGDGADVGRVARADEDDGDAGQLRIGEHASPIVGTRFRENPSTRDEAALE